MQVKGQQASDPLQQLALHEGFDHVVCGGEVPGLVGDVHRLEAGGERVLRQKVPQKIRKKNSSEIPSPPPPSLFSPAACPPSF